MFYAAGFEVYSLLLSNNYDDEIEEGRPLYNKYELVAGLGAKRILSINSGNAFEELSGFHKEKPSWLFGYMGYDLKNETEKILSENEDRIGLDDMFFFEPEVLILVQGNKIQITSEVHNPEMVWEEITNAEIKESPKQSIELIPKISQEKYLEVVEKLRQHIIEGDIYEINFCQEFFAEDVSIDAEDLFLKLIEVSPNPFSALLKTKAAYIISSSMERFMKKVESKLISQPIKGTIKRTGNKEEDAALQHQLFNDEKERAENVMIVDLVRNDLAKSCKTGSVKVEELFGIYPFSQVFQMISTVVGELREEINWVDAIR
ncbi:MAG: chorismate-binding protein, partial [Bacteroidetes bacterium]|nr:chorismate-binding protein [Bacteroidota bacterium]